MMYGDIVRFFGSGDPVTRRLFAEFLGDGEGCAVEIADLLFTIDPVSGKTAARLGPLLFHWCRCRDVAAATARMRQLGYILTGDDASPDCPWTFGRSRYLVETSPPGIFAARDLRYRSVKRFAAGVGEGSMAIAFVHQFLQAEMGV